MKPNPVLKFAGLIGVLALISAAIASGSWPFRFPTTGSGCTDCGGESACCHFIDCVTCRPHTIASIASVAEKQLLLCWGALLDFAWRVV